MAPNHHRARLFFDAFNRTVKQLEWGYAIAWGSALAGHAVPAQRPAGETD